MVLAKRRFALHQIQTVVTRQTSQIAAANQVILALSQQSRRNLGTMASVLTLHALLILLKWGVLQEQSMLVVVPYVWDAIRATTVL
jgi:hypothetical protein